MLDSEKTFKMKIRSRWTVFEISLTAVVICNQKSFPWKRDKNVKRHEVEQGFSKKLL